MPVSAVRGRYTIAISTSIHDELQEHIVVIEFVIERANRCIYSIQHTKYHRNIPGANTTTIKTNTTSAAIETNEVHANVDKSLNKHNGKIINVAVRPMTD